MLTWAVAAVLATLAAVRLFGDGAEQAPPIKINGGRGASPSAADDGATGRRGDTRGERAPTVYVHVAGQVRRPGLYRVAGGSRVAVALQRAGGPLRRAELTAVNLAAKVVDGQQIVVPKVGAPLPAAGSGAGAAPGASGAKLSLATASEDQLDELDGIGPTLAQRIVEYRDSHGGFRSLEQLREVDGIGEKRFASLREGLQP